MCGIAGFVDADLAPAVRTEAVERMCAAMAHRGPDDRGVIARTGVTLGMRRLAIFDPANGRQPMQSPDGRFTIVFNGAIYNFRELRRELGHWAFRTECDTEVLLAAYVRWGARAVRRLRGMFAFAVWDEQERTLLLARDAFGIKPLYYRHDGGRLIFASELNGLIASGAFAPELDAVAVADYLAWLAVPAPRTIYRDVFTLRPGECATFRNGRLEVRPSWDFRHIPDADRVCASREEFIAELRGRLEDTVRAHCLADVPVGAFLSGGLDSAVVTGLMARASDTRLRTFSIDFDEPGYSEAAGAESTARHLGTEHRTTVLTGAEVARDVETLLHTLDQPTGDGVNTYYASRAARSGGVTVALSGLGGDELFGGYPSFRDTPRITRWLPRWRALPRPMRSALVRRLEHGDTRRRKLADVLAHARSLHEVGALQRRVFSEPNRRALLHPDITRTIGSRPVFHPELVALAHELNGSDEFDVVSAWELRTYMADVLLRDSDVMSMRHSLELRVPLVDRPLIEWLWRQPAAFKSDARHPKSALAEAVRDLVPPDIATRPKRGFALPFERWMKHELRPFLDETFSDASIARSGFLDRDSVQTLWRGFLDGHDPREWSRVWSLAVFVAFAGRRPAATALPRAPSVRVTSDERTPAPRKSVRRLLLAPEIFSSEGGIPRILQTYLKALSDLADGPGSVRLLALNDPAIAEIDVLRATNGRVEAPVGCGRRKLRFVREALRLSRSCDEIVCGHVFLLPVAWLAQRLNPRLRYHLVAHGIEVWRNFSLAERIALRGATRVLCVSDYTRRELLRNCPLPEGRAVVLHNALDPAFAITAGRPPAECAPVIVAVTRLTYADRYKGIQHLIEAMPAIRAAVPGARLRLIGRGDDIPRLKKIAQRTGVTDAIDFAGYLDDHTLAEEMASCRLFALPSRKEGFGLVFLEAMAHGRPCLGARAGGVPEVITEDTGVLVDYGDVDGIARATIAALERRWDTGKIVARAAEFSFPHFKERLAAHLAA